MKPADIQRQRRTLEQGSLSGFFARTFSSKEYMEEAYQLRFATPPIEEGLEGEEGEGAPVEGQPEGGKPAGS